MHPRQAQLSQKAEALSEKLAAKSGGRKQQQAAGVALWKYTDPDGREFWLKEKKVSIRSPYSGKNFAAKPVKETMSGVGQDLREEAKAPAAGAGPGGKVQTKRQKKAELEEWKAHSFEQPVDATTQSNG